MKALTVKTYPGIVHKENNSCYGISFPDFPGCVSAGDTLDELHAMAKEALVLAVDGLLADGDPVPEPSTLEAARTNPMAKKAVLFIGVDVPVPDARAVRLNISLPKLLLGQLDAYAVRTGQARSAVLAQAAARYINTTPTAP
jgi:predicted RNase H-like HicB family nuclease